MSLPPASKQLIPISRDTLNQMHHNTQIYYATTSIQLIVKEIYTNAIYYANTTMNKYYYHKLPLFYYYNTIPLIYDAYGSIDCRNIVSELKTLFTNCSIEIKLLYEDPNGTLYNYGGIQPYSIYLRPAMCIVIDWF
jgi:hypothetical protein